MSFIPTQLPGDSLDYHFLYDAAKSLTPDIFGLTCEIGLRRGGGTEAIVRGCVDAGHRRTHVAIDPYGDIPYAEGARLVHHDYTHEMQAEALPDIFDFAYTSRTQFIFMPLEDTEFFKRYADGVPVYQNGQKQIINSYALVHFDGPHSVPAVLAEIDFFCPRTPVGGIWVFDDVLMYDHIHDVHPDILARNFELIRQSQRKMVYRKLP